MFRQLTRSKLEKGGSAVISCFENTHRSRIAFRYSVTAVEVVEVFFEACFGDVSLYGFWVYSLASFVYVFLVDVCAEDLDGNVVNAFSSKNSSKAMAKE